MFRIYDGRERFYQWDTDRKLIVNDASITQVHFCNKTDECSLVCATYAEDGLNVVDVPNILLQDNWAINVYAYDKNYTKFSARFEVEKRTKPADYVYTETEVLNYENLMARLDDIEGTIGETVEEYLVANPPEVSLDGFYTKEETDKAIEEAVGAIEIPDVPETDLSDYATKKYVDDAVAAIDIPTVPDVSEFITMEDVEEKGYLTEHQQLKTINGESIVGTGNIVIEGGSGTDGAEAINEVYIGTDAPTDANVELWINPNETGAEYALKSDIPDVSGFTTEEDVNALINTALGVIENGAY